MVGRRSAAAPVVKRRPGTSSTKFVICMHRAGRWGHGLPGQSERSYAERGRVLRSVSYVAANPDPRNRGADLPIEPIVIGRTGDDAGGSYLSVSIHLVPVSSRMSMNNTSFV